MDRNWRWLAGLLLTLCLSSQLAIAEDVESPKDDIAAQIRAQGYACDQPQSATRDPSLKTRRASVAVALQGRELSRSSHT